MGGIIIQDPCAGDNAHREERCADKGGDCTADGSGDGALIGAFYNARRLGSDGRTGNTQVRNIAGQNAMYVPGTPSMVK